ncbi:hypothetical protein [Alloscardovia macacae]|uniref:Uncharacterized protein n=1 Tax=Alloscardovia macacae TaxID=1160091 RepID=A0A261F1W6_9BIFI|nr:hypothetical protein [Alloscardovia macacae]OZG53107.1 hypothetical protein ALMA_1409 [Alloscardovia macacae]
MLNRLAYFSASTQREYNLDGVLASAGTASSLRGSQFAYTLGTRDITGVSRIAYEASFSLTTTDFAYLDDVLSVFARDVEAGTPGRLRIDDWYQSAYIVDSEADKITPTLVSVKLKAVLLAGVWHRDTAVNFTTSYIPVDTRGDLDYPYNFSHDYAKTFDYATDITVDTLSGADISLTIYGQTVNPSITIGDNVYAVNVTVPSNGVLKVDGLTHTVTLYDADGMATNVFAKAKRETGSNIFHRLGSGVSTVAWNRGFNFDITVHETSGGPLWAYQS